MIITIVRKFCEATKQASYQVDKGIYRYSPGCYFYEVLDEFFDANYYQEFLDTIFVAIESGSVLNLNGIKQLGIGSNKANIQFKRQL